MQVSTFPAADATAALSTIGIAKARVVVKAWLSLCWLTASSSDEAATVALLSS